MILLSIVLPFSLALGMLFLSGHLNLALCDAVNSPVPQFYERETNKTAAIFSHIYDNNLWGANLAKTPFSGPGSHDNAVVLPYVSAIRSFVTSTFVSIHPNVVDLGCGDFNIGKQIRNLTNNYIAIDIVPEVINYNRLIYAQPLAVDFRILDMITAREDELPEGDVVFIREVLQHLSNDQIARLVKKLGRKYRWAVITEALPLADGFVANQDIETGEFIRMALDSSSGVVLEEQPFGLVHFGKKVICEVVGSYHASSKKVNIKTVVYQLQRT